VHIRSKLSVATLVTGYSVAILLIGCQQPESAFAEAKTNTVPQTELDKTLYALGAMLGVSLEEFSLKEGELEWVQRGIADQSMGREPAINPEVYAAQVRKLQQERTEDSIVMGDDDAAFLAKQAAVDGAVVSESGLIMQEMTAGEGASPAVTDTVLVHYHGTLVDGTVFDSSVDRGEPARFPLNRVIPCWTEGVAKMKVGGKSRLVCPPQIAYGARGAGKIPPNAPISFEVELIEIE
jgi:FKBP-type peptidyl-prolyl cis-trans isomerase FkpA